VAIFFVRHAYFLHDWSANNRDKMGHKKKIWACFWKNRWHSEVNVVLMLSKREVKKNPSSFCHFRPFEDAS